MRYAPGSTTVQAGDPVPVLVEIVLKCQDIEDQTADRHKVILAGGWCFKMLLGFGPEAADHGFVRVNIEFGYGGEGGAK